MQEVLQYQQMCQAHWWLAVGIMIGRGHSDAGELAKRMPPGGTNAPAKVPQFVNAILEGKSGGVAAILSQWGLDKDKEEPSIVDTIVRELWEVYRREEFNRERQRLEYMRDPDDIANQLEHMRVRMAELSAAKQKACTGDG